MDFIEQAILEGVAFDDLGLDIDELMSYEGFFEWVTYDPEIDEAVWNEEEGCWEYPEDYDDDEDYDEDYDDEDYWDRYWEEIEELSEMHEKLEKCVERINKK